ncbi:MAG TPA: DUF802 domain-containing protein, partial [Rhodocyclaceae bacterium]|nr:DUF802 domain-containing protein [Rhodocyclaceae bacterium]
TRIATVLRGFSLVHQRQETFKALQLQSQAMPAVVDKLQAMMVLMEERNQQLNERLLASQEDFHRDVKGVYTELAGTVDASLKTSLVESARLAGETLRPAVETTMAGIARETTALHENVAATLNAQLDGLAARFDGTVAKVAETWTTALAKQDGHNATLSGELRQSLSAFAENFEQRSVALLAGVNAAQASAQAEQAARDEQRLAALTGAVQAMATSLQHEWQEAGAQTLAQQQQICTTLEETARELTAQTQAQAGQTIAEIGQLLQAAAEAPRAAAEVIGQLRQELSNSLAHDNGLLEERSRIMATLSGLLDAINHAAVEQRGVIDSLVANSAAVLERVSVQFSEKIGAESTRMVDVATQMSSSAVEVASLSEAFGFAVQQFSASNDKMIANLQRIEGSLESSMARSDEQLAYYVAQAREIIDLSIMSQKKIVDDLQRLSSRPLADELA